MTLETEWRRLIDAIGPPRTWRPRLVAWIRRLPPWYRQQHEEDRALFDYSLYASFFLSPPASWSTFSWNNPLLRTFSWKYRPTPAVIYLVLLIVGFPLARFFGRTVPDVLNILNYTFVVPLYWMLSYAFYNQMEWYWAQLVKNEIIKKRSLVFLQRKYAAGLRGRLIPVLAGILAIVLQHHYLQSELIEGRYLKWQEFVGDEQPWLIIAYYLLIQGLSLFTLIMLAVHAILCGAIFKRLFRRPYRIAPDTTHKDNRLGLSGHGRLAIILGLLLGDLFLNIVTWRANLDAPASEWVATVLFYALGPVIIVFYMLPAHRFMAWHKHNLLTTTPEELPGNETGENLHTWPISVKSIVGFALTYLQYLVSLYVKLQLIR